METKSICDAFFVLVIRLHLYSHSTSGFTVTGGNGFPCVYARLINEECAVPPKSRVHARGAEGHRPEV